MSEPAARVAILLQDLRGGGYERMMINLAGEWRRSGLAVDLVLVEARGAYVPLIAEGVRVVPLGGGRTLTSLLPLVRYLRREQPAALLSGLAHVNALAAAAALVARKPTRIVLSERNMPAREMRAPEVATRLGYRLAPWAYRRADAVIAVSAGVADDMADRLSVPRDRVHVIENPVVTPELRARMHAPVSHPWLGQDVPTVLAAGRLAPQKDHATLLRAFARVAAEQPCRLIIVGEGPERARLERLARELRISDRVDMPGFAENPYAMMHRASLFVLSSAYEGSPNVLVEAMAAGVPVVATDCPSGPREILLGGSLAPLVGVGDVVGLTEAMIAELGRPRKTARLEERAMDFDSARSSRAYLDVLLGAPVRNVRR